MAEANNDLFARFWSVYPRRHGSAGKAIARVKFERACRKVDPEVLIAAARQYAAENEKKVGTEFIAMASTWLTQRRWEDYESEPDRPRLSDAERDRLMEQWRRKQESMW